MTTNIPPGLPIVVTDRDTLELTDDVVLNGDSLFQIKDCTVKGNGHKIVTNSWRGRLDLDAVLFEDLGKAETDGLYILAGGASVNNLTNCTLRRSSSIYMWLGEGSSASFIGNTIEDNSIVPISKDAQSSRAQMVFTGPSVASKLFQGNRIYKSWVQFEESANWQIGGPLDKDSNLIIGLRAGVFARGARTSLNGNYIHCLLPHNDEFPYWSQVSTLGIGPGVLAEYNVIRTGDWVARGIFGELRYSVILEAEGHENMQIGTGHVHHCFFGGKMQDPPGYGAQSFVRQVYATDGFNFHNNVLDADGDGLAPCGVGIAIQDGSVIPSVRNNAFVRFKTPAKTAVIMPAEGLSSPMPERVGYADYNLFNYVASSPNRQNYGLAVIGKKLGDPGFAGHDAGSIDASVDPQFVGPMISGFPFDDADIKSGKVTVSQILKTYWDAYTPAQGSPLIGAGDPADGNINIGMVGPVGTPPPDPRDKEIEVLQSQVSTLIKKIIAITDKFNRLGAKSHDAQALAV